MGQLVINELRQMRNVLLVVVAVTVASSLACAAVKEPDLAAGFRFVLVMVPVYFGLSLPAMSFRNENRGGTWRFLRALPGSGSTVVSAKVVAALVVLGLGSIAAVGGLMIADGHGSLLRAAHTLSLPAIFGVGLMGINFALCFRLGERNAGLALLVILAAVQIAGILQVAFAPAGGGISGLIVAMERWFGWAKTPVGLLICAGTALGVLAVGWAVSIRIYDARDITQAM